MKLKPEDYEKLETQKLANIIRKLGRGGTLTKREEETLERSKLKDAGAAGAAESEASNYAHTWDELARILSQRLGVSVTRKSLQNWRDPKMFPDLADKWPRDRADGRKDVPAWMKFMFDTGRHRADETLEADEANGDRKTVRDWKMYREELMCRESERRIARGDNLLLVAHELEIPIGSLLAAINSKLQLYSPRTARFMVMKRDVADAERTLQDEMDAVIKDLNLADYLEPPLEETLSNFPFDDETAGLYRKVAFDGHDRAGFVELIRRSVAEVLRRIGQRVLRSADQPTEPAEPQTTPSDTVRVQSEKVGASEPVESATKAESPSGSGTEADSHNSSPKQEHVTRPGKRGGKARAKSTTR